MQLEATERHRSYLAEIEGQLERMYDIAGRARSKGLDPVLKPESYVARDLAEMVEGLVGPRGVGTRIRELIAMKKDKYEMAFVVALDIVHAKFGHIDPEETAEQAVKTALAIMTGGITAAPIQGLAHVRVKQNFDKTRYLAVYFAGPIRSAGGTEQALTLVVADYVRRLLGLDSYKIIQSEVRRFLEELRLYEREVSRFQYHVSDEDIVYALQNLPIEATGTETDPIEVSSYRNLPRIETNRIRAGGLRVVNDGIVGRSQKVQKIVEDNGIQGWEWLKKLKHVQQETTDADAAYMEDVIAGRPIFSFPSKSGGFRLRYGRSRNTGLAAMGIHPATMAILLGFLASGTQIRVEGPGKGGIVLPVDTIEPPIVKLADGSVMRVESYEEALALRKDVVKILFLGDLLVAFGEFLENNKPLAPSGYTEEWWVQELMERIESSYGGSVEVAAHSSGFDASRLCELSKDPLGSRPTAQEALDLSRVFGVPLHPRFTYFWRNIDFDDLSALRQAFMQSPQAEKKVENTTVLLQLTTRVKEILEKLCVPHRVSGSWINFEEDGTILKCLLRFSEPNVRLKRQKSTLEALTLFSGLTLRDKSQTYIGARMGRPEKAKRREMSPLVHVLFPVSLAGGSHRNILAAAKQGTIQVEIVRRRCPQCNKVTYENACSTCGVHTIEERICPRCHRTSQDTLCPACNILAINYDVQELNIGEIYSQALDRVGGVQAEEVKGVRGLSSTSKVPELIEKGILRAKYGLSVFKDGTIRFDVTNAPLTHFRPKEISISVRTLTDFGYSHDLYGSPLRDETQTCELKVQDIILPEKAIKYFLNLCRFIDELLQRVYGLSSFYNVKTEQDLVGQLVLGFAPHTSAAVVGRILGFSKTNVCYAHPLWHNIKRRDCDGDEDAIMLVLDVLLNFSKAYLPAQIGGMMDAPLLIISTVDPFEVDEAQNMDAASSYPLVFYEKTLEHWDSKAVSEVIDIVAHRLGTPAQFEGYFFSHITNDINEGNLESAYIRLGSMSDKLANQLELAEKISAVDSREVARRVLSRHLMQDIVGNLKAFTGQKFRCKKCNAKYRRIPLSGKCWHCNGELLMTVHRKGIEKYLDIAEDLIEKYKLDQYYVQRIKLVRDEISYLFTKPETKEVVATKRRQVKLGEFM